MNVFDKDLIGKDDFMGTVSVPVVPLLDEKIRDEWFPLQKRKGHDSDEVKGDVHLRVQFKPVAVSGENLYMGREIFAFEKKKNPPPKKNKQPNKQSNHYQL